MVSNWVDVRGRRLHARVSADTAPLGSLPLVLVHGLLVSSRYMVPLASRLAPSFPVHAPDLPGYGRSVKPRRTLDVPALADALVDYLEAAGLEQVVLVANSLGCQIAVDCAARYPARVRKLVLLGPTVDPSSRPTAKLALRWLLNVPLEPVSLDLVVLRDLLDMGPRRLLHTFRAMMDDRIETKLPLVRAPALVVRGGRDSTVSQEWAEQVVRLLPRGGLAVVPGVAHTINYNSPREVAQLVRTFVDSPVEGEMAARMG
jgi:pimeloyl-ACP methyl ester carboxylesterase